MNKCPISDEKNYSNMISNFKTTHFNKKDLFKLKLENKKSKQKMIIQKKN